ncbi:MAG: glycosyltransferase family 39 protein [Planctomycetota bacterium]
MHDRTTQEGPAAPALDDGRPARDRVATWLLALACAVGLLRLVRLGEWGLWIDEVFTYADAVNRGSDVNPFGYALWRAWLGLVGPLPDEFDLRLPAAVLGLLCVPLTAFAARPLVGARPAAAAALLLAASSWHLYWSQNARFYTLAMALSLFGAGLALRGARANRLPTLLVGWAVAATACLVHPSSALALPGLVAGPLFVRRSPLRLHGRTRRVALAVLVVAAVVGSLWAYDVLWLWDRKKGVGNPAHLVLTTGFFVTPVAAAAALFGAIDVARRRPHPATIALWVAFAGLGGAAAASLFVRTSAQYVFVLLPWVLVLAVAPLARAHANRSDERGSDAPALHGFAAIAWVGVLAATALTNSLLQLTVRHGERPMWREAWSVVAEQRRDGDLVLGMAAPVGQYYLEPGCTNPRDLTALSYLNPYAYDAPMRAAALGRRTWFVVNQERFAEWPVELRDELRRLLREDCRLVADFPLQIESRDLGVQVFLREPRP